MKISENKIKEAIAKSLKEFTNKPKEEFHPASFFNLDEIPDNELKKQGLGFRFTIAYGGNFSYDGKNVLKEEAIETISPEETIKDIKMKFRLSDWQIDIENGANQIKLLFIIPSIEKEKKLLIDAMETCGWSFGCNEIKYDRFGTAWVAMSFDPMFQDDISEEARKYKFLFHWSPKYNMDSILKNGLIPKSENEWFSYPSRVHLIKGNISVENILKFGKTLCNKNNNPNNDGNYVLFAIETAKLPTDFPIYYDPRFEYGYYVKQTIPSKAINDFKEYKFNK